MIRYWLFNQPLAVAIQATAVCQAIDFRLRLAGWRLDNSPPRHASSVRKRRPLDPCNTQAVQAAPGSLRPWHQALGHCYQRPPCYRTADRLRSNRKDCSRRRNTAGNPTGRIRDLVQTRIRCQRQRSDRDRNGHAADPNRGANLRHDVQRYGPFARSIRVVQLFQMIAPLKRWPHD